MEEKKKLSFWEALGRLPAHEQVIIFIGFVGAITLVIGGIFYLMLTKTSMVNFKMPDPEFQKNGDIQNYKYMTYSDLNILVQFPNTNYAVYVGGQESLYTDYAASFIYDANKRILVGVCDKTQPLSEFFNIAVPQVLESGDYTTEKTYYKSMAHKEGYLNSNFLIYEAGAYSLGKTYYMLSYLYDAGNKYLLMATVFEKPDKIAAYSAKQLLDKVYVTLSKLNGEDALGVKVTVDDSSVGEGSSDSGDSSVDDSSAAGSSEERTATEIVTENMQEVKEKAYALEYPDAVDLDEQIFVSDEFSSEKSVIYIWYSEPYSVPDEAYLISPAGLKYAPAYKNESYTGMVYWILDGPPSGFWTIHLSANIRYGTYKMNVLTKEGFDAAFGEQTDPYPKDPQ